MSIEDNRKVALQFVENLSTGDIEGALDLIDEDVTWWLAGKPDQFEIAGSKTKQEFADMLQTIGTGMPNGMQLTVTGSPIARIGRDPPGRQHRRHADRPERPLDTRHLLRRVGSHSPPVRGRPGGAAPAVAAGPLLVQHPRGPVPDVPRPGQH